MSNRDFKATVSYVRVNGETETHVTESITISGMFDNIRNKAQEIDSVTAENEAAVDPAKELKTLHITVDLPLFLS